MAIEQKTQIRLLIEDWLPIAALGEESVRERRSMTALPPTYYLHVWWARRPLVASRAAVLASILPNNADKKKFMHILGIHGDPVATKLRIEWAKIAGKNLGPDVYGYKRAFSYSPTKSEIDWITSSGTDSAGKIVVLDPMAGGGSIPFESLRLGIPTIANELNQVGWLVLKSTVEFPRKFQQQLLDRFSQLARLFSDTASAKLHELYPRIDPGEVINAFIWCRTVHCPYCGGEVPLAPDWRLNDSGTGIRLVPRLVPERLCEFEVVQKEADQSKGTTKDRDALCPFPDCERVIDSSIVKSQAQAGEMRDKMYAVVYSREEKSYVNGKAKVSKTRCYRTPNTSDSKMQFINELLEAKMPIWLASDYVPNEQVLPGQKTMELLQFGVNRWVDAFGPRQLAVHVTGIETFNELVDSLKSCGQLNELDTAALTYVALSLDKLLNYNSRMSVWSPARQVVTNTFNRHDFAYCATYAEMALSTCGSGYEWAFEQTHKALNQLIDLVKSSPIDTISPSNHLTPTCYRGSADALPMLDDSVACIVIDPPYYDNVMYAELADFFYVWLKRSVGRLYPDIFKEFLTDKDREAVANPSRFRGEKSATASAKADYQSRMASIFSECRRVLKSDGVMTVMFTHKATGAWDALASSLISAGFVITASWPINTEAESSLHINAKSAAKSTILLVCRPSETSRHTEQEARYWEDIEPKLISAVRRKIPEFQSAGISGVDLYLACFGPALEIFSEAWPLKRGRAVQVVQSRKKSSTATVDPYAVTPEDALDAARREVKAWRLEQLASSKRRHNIDPLTEWYILAWDAFKAPRFPADEGLKLARVVGLDFDQAIKNHVCEVKSNSIVLWDSKTRQSKSKLPNAGNGIVLDTLHNAMTFIREGNTGAGVKLLEDMSLLEDQTTITAIEALLNVLPAPELLRKMKRVSALTGAAADYDALDRLRILAFADVIPEPEIKQLIINELAQATLNENGEDVVDDEDTDELMEDE